MTLFFIINYISGNEITKISGLDPKKLARLSELELRANKLVSTAGVFLPNLKKLYLAENKIERIEQLSKLEHLSILHLRDNNISKLDGFSDCMSNLQYLNLRWGSIFF